MFGLQFFNRHTTASSSINAHRKRKLHAVALKSALTLDVGMIVANHHGSALT
jgi:hypothetical protein